MEKDPLQPIIIPTQRRHRRRKRRVRLGPWLWRAGIAAVFLGVMGVVLSRAFEPYSMRYRQKKETRALLEQLADLNEQNHSLKRQIENLRSGVGLEQEARRLGYIRKGEVPLQITFETPKPTPAKPDP